MAFVAPLIPVVTGAVAASSTAGLLLIGSAAVSAVGAITGDKDLQKLGTLVGIGTGIAAATGVIGTEAAVAGTAESAADSAVLEGADIGEVTGADYFGSPEVTGAAVDTSTAAGKTISGVDPENATKTGGLVTKAGVNAGASTTPAVTEAVKQTTTKNHGFFDKILSNPQSMYGAGLIAQGIGPVIAGGFAGNTEEEKLELLKQQEEARQAELERRAGNFNNIPSVNLGVAPSGQRLYRTPRPLINPYRSPVLPN